MNKFNSGTFVPSTSRFEIDAILGQEIFVKYLPLSKIGM